MTRRYVVTVADHSGKQWDVLQTDYADYALSEAERLRGNAPNRLKCVFVWDTDREAYVTEVEQ